MRVVFGVLVFVLVISMMPARGQSDDIQDGHRWLAGTRTVQTAGILWNDRIGDGQDRYKTGGLTQSFIFPERLISYAPWVDGRASALELQGRALVITPDDTTNGANPADRAFAQFAALGLYLRMADRPQAISPGLSKSLEDRIGLEIGYQGEPLPLFDVQDGLHDLVGRTETAADDTNTLGGATLVNVEVQRLWRIHADWEGSDLELAPFLRGSAGTRETSLWAGGDVILGSALAGRIWTHDPALGALIPGGSQPRDGMHWMAWIGGGIGAFGSDFFLDERPSGIHGAVNGRRIRTRARAGVMIEYAPVALGYSLAWLGPEFHEQEEGQFIGAMTLKYRF